MPEIRRAEEALATLARERDLAVVQLYGDLASAEQDRVLRPGPRRKVVLATNVAETSITVDGVTGVIDSGWVKESGADPATGLERLALTRISRASAEQRAGRAGRQAPGWCLRLWSEHEHRGLQERSRPEIRRADLAWTALQLAAWGERDLARFPWFEAPDESALASAEASLTRLGALAPDGITPLGRRLAEFPLHPRLALLVLDGERRGVADDAALVAALLSERDPTATSESRVSGARTSAQSDLLVKLDSLRSARSSSSSTLLRTRDSLLDAVRRSAGGDSGKRRRPAGLERGTRGVSCSGRSSPPGPTASPGAASPAVIGPSWSVAAAYASPAKARSRTPSSSSASASTTAVARAPKHWSASPRRSSATGCRQSVCAKRPSSSSTRNANASSPTVAPPTMTWCSTTKRSRSATQRPPPPCS